MTCVINCHSLSSLLSTPGNEYQIDQQGRRPVCEFSLIREELCRYMDSSDSQSTSNSIAVQTENGNLCRLPRENGKPTPKVNPDRWVLLPGLTFTASGASPASKRDMSEAAKHGRLPEVVTDSVFSAKEAGLR